MSMPNLPTDPTKRSERLNVRLSSEALVTIREAAQAQQQDLTSFVLGAALDRARAVLVEDRLMRLSPYEVQQLEDALDQEPQVNEVLASRLRRVQERHGLSSPRNLHADA